MDCKWRWAITHALGRLAVLLALVMAAYLAIRGPRVTTTHQKTVERTVVGQPNTPWTGSTGRTATSAE